MDDWWKMYFHLNESYVLVILTVSMNFNGDHLAHFGPVISN